MENATPNNLAETLAQELKKPFEFEGCYEELEHVRRYAIPPGWTIKEFDDEKLCSIPRRKVATVRLDSVNSFIEYVSRHGTDNTTVWVKADYTAGKVELTAIVNDHGPDESSLDRDWRDHRAYYAPAFSEEWKRWKGNDKKPMSQAEFATFIGDNLADIAGGEQLPSGADMLRMALDFEAKQDMRFKSAIRLQSGGVDLSFVQQEDTGTLEKMKLFDRFSVGIAVFWGDSAYRVDARLRYRVREGKLSFWYELIRADKVLEAAAVAIVAKIGTATNRTPFFGNPFAA